MLQKSSLSLVTIRRLLVKRPWVYWATVAIVATGVAASILQRADDVDAERSSWGETVEVLTATVDHAPGDVLRAEVRRYPAAVVPESAVAVGGEHVARQHIVAGDIVTTPDVVATAGAQALIPDGWLAVPIVESPRVGATVGDRVIVAADGFVLADDAIVVGSADDVTLVAVPAADAPTAAAAGTERAITLLLRP